MLAPQVVRPENLSQNESPRSAYIPVGKIGRLLGFLIDCLVVTVAAVFLVVPVAGQLVAGAIGLFSFYFEISMERALER